MARGRRRRSLLERLVPADDDIRKEKGLHPWFLASEVSLPPEVVAGLATVESFENRHLEVFYSTLADLGLREQADRWREACQIQVQELVVQGQVGRALSASPRGPAIPPEPLCPLGKNKPAMAHDAEEGFRVLRQLRLLRLWGPRLLGHGLSEADLLYFGSRLGEINTRMFEVRLLEPRAVGGIAHSRRMSSIGKRRWEWQPIEWDRFKTEARRLVEEAKRRGEPVPSKRALARTLSVFFGLSAEAIRKRL